MLIQSLQMDRHLKIQDSFKWKYVINFHIKYKLITPI